MREKRVILEEKSDSTPLRRDKFAIFVVHPNFTAKVYKSVCGSFESGECAQDRRFTGAGRTKEDGNGRGIEFDLQVSIDQRTFWKCFPKMQDQRIGHTAIPLRCSP